MINNTNTQHITSIQIKADEPLNLPDYELEASPSANMYRCNAPMIGRRQAIDFGNLQSFQIRIVNLSAAGRRAQNEGSEDLEDPHD